MSRATVKTIALIALCSLSLYLCGCTAVNKMMRSLYNEPIPEFGSPDSTAMVVVDCKVLYSSRSRDLFQFGEWVSDALSEAISGKDEVYKVYSGNLINDEGHQIFGDFYHRLAEVKQLLIFGNVEPGKYSLENVSVIYTYECEKKNVWDGVRMMHVDTVGTCFDSSTINLPPDIQEELSVEAILGKTVYAGMLIIIDKLDNRNDNQYIIEYSPEREIKAFRGLIDECKECPWANRWQERIKELEVLIQKEESN